MAKSHQARPHRICESLSLSELDDPHHKTLKHHDVKRCPLCCYQRKRVSQFSGHLKKARGLKASAEARRIRKKTAVMAAKLEKLATCDAPEPSKPSMNHATDSSAASYYTPNASTNLPLSPAHSIELSPMNDTTTNAHSPPTRTHDEVRPVLRRKSNQRSQSSPPALSYSMQLPPTPTSSTSTNPTPAEETFIDSPTNTPYPTRTATPTTLQHESIPEPAFLPHDLDLDWDPDWDLDLTTGYPQYNRGGMRAMFENNQKMYDVSLAYLLSFDPLSC